MAEQTPPGWKYYVAESRLLPMGNPDNAAGKRFHQIGEVISQVLVSHGCSRPIHVQRLDRSENGWPLGPDLSDDDSYSYYNSTSAIPGGAASLAQLNDWIGSRGKYVLSLASTIDQRPLVDDLYSRVGDLFLPARYDLCQRIGGPSRAYQEWRKQWRKEQRGT